MLRRCFKEDRNFLLETYQRNQKHSCLQDGHRRHQHKWPDQEAAAQQVREAAGLLLRAPLSRCGTSSPAWTVKRQQAVPLSHQPVWLTAMGLWLTAAAQQESCSLSVITLTRCCGAASCCLDLRHETTSRTTKHEEPSSVYRPFRYHAESL